MFLPQSSPLGPFRWVQGDPSITGFINTCKLRNREQYKTAN